MSVASQHMWVVLGDIHEEISRFNDIPEVAQADGIIVTGDITQAGGVAQAERVMGIIAAAGKPVYAQIGNMDNAEITPWLDEKQWNLHTLVRELLPTVGMFGAGASITTPFNTPSEFSEEQYTQWLEAAWEKVRRYPGTVLVSHNPPKDTVCDTITNGMHVGSVAVRKFIETYQPDICLCGHIHEARGVDTIGRTVIINPGNFGSGGYAILEKRGDELAAQLRMLSKV